MNSNLKWKAVFIAIVILICLIGLVGRPDFPPKSWAGIKSNFGQVIKLGLDLQGGTHLILQVQVQEAVSAPRVHYENGVVFAEPGVELPPLAPDTEVVRFAAINLFFGGVQAVLRDGETLSGAGDPRRGGVAVSV